MAPVEETEEGSLRQRKNHYPQEAACNGKAGKVPCLIHTVLSIIPIAFVLFVYLLEVEVIRCIKQFSFSSVIDS